MAKKGPDWAAIRLEYETTKISYRKLATKHSVSFSTLEKRARREHWRAAADLMQNAIDSEVATAARQRVASHVARKSAEKAIREIDPALEATELINQLVLETLMDAKQFNRHLIQVKDRTPQIVTLTTSSGKETEKVMSVEHQEVEERIYDVVDTKRLQELAKALQISKELQRTLQGILDPADKAKNLIDKRKIRIDKERLELQKVEAAQKSKITDEGIVIQMEGELEEWSE